VALVQTLERFACCSRDGVEPACGQLYDSVGMAFLERDSSGLYYRCSTCDFGIVAPYDELSRREPNGVLRIKRAKFRRDAATKAREALIVALRPLEAMLKDLEAVDPPDFGSFTDWMQRRQELMRSGQARGACTSCRAASLSLSYKSRHTTHACLSKIARPNGVHDFNLFFAGQALAVTCVRVPCSAGRRLVFQGPPRLRHRRPARG
jgi:hypothetical protein